MVNLITSKGLEDMYGAGVPKYHICLGTISKLMQKCFPHLVYHIENKIGMQLEIIMTEWIMTFFIGYIDDSKLIIPLLDAFILQPDEASSWHVFYCFILAFFKQNCRFLMEIYDLQDFNQYFKKMKDM
jgi:hypothetical protein